MNVAVYNGVAIKRESVYIFNTLNGLRSGLASGEITMKQARRHFAECDGKCQMMIEVLGDFKDPPAQAERDQELGESKVKRKLDSLADLAELLNAHQAKENAETSDEAAVVADTSRDKIYKALIDKFKGHAKAQRRLGKSIRKFSDEGWFIARQPLVLITETQPRTAVGTFDENVELGVGFDWERAYPAWIFHDQLIVAVHKDIVNSKEFKSWRESLIGIIRSQTRLTVVDALKESPYDKEAFTSQKFPKWYFLWFLVRRDFNALMPFKVSNVGFPFDNFAVKEAKQSVRDRLSKFHEEFDNEVNTELQDYVDGIKRLEHEIDANTGELETIRIDVSNTEENIRTVNFELNDVSRGSPKWRQLFLKKERLWKALEGARERVDHMIDSLKTKRRELKELKDEYQAEREIIRKDLVDRIKR